VDVFWVWDQRVREVVMSTWVSPVQTVEQETLWAKVDTTEHDDGVANSKFTSRLSRHHNATRRAMHTGISSLNAFDRPRGPGRRPKQEASV
jgi:hypothetical protein